MNVITSIKAFRLKKSKLFVILCALLALYYTEYVDCLLAFFNNQYWASENEQYLKSTELSAGEVLLLLNELKAMISILESSFAGVSFIVEAKVQVGKIVTPLQIFVDYAITATLLSLCGTISFDIIINTVKLLTAPITTVTTVSMGVYYFFRGYGYVAVEKTSKRLSSFLLVLTIFSYFIIPLTIYSTNYISNKVIANVTEETHSYIKELHTKFQLCKKSNLDDQVQSLVKFSHKLSDDIKYYSYKLAQQIIRYIMYIFFRIILFPLILCLMMLWIVKLLIHHILETEKN